MSKEVSKSKQGKLNRAAGTRFEAKVRNDLDSKGWVLSKWMNNVDLEKQKIVPAKRKYNPFLRALSIGTGFPDFVGIKRSGKFYDVVGIEVKRNGWLDREEKEKCVWYLKNKIFSKILIAKAKKDGRNLCVEYADFEKKHIGK